MTDKEKIIRILSEKATAEEKENFSKELKNSAALKEQYDKIQSTIDRYRETEKIQLPNEYLIGLSEKVNNRIFSKSDKVPKLVWQRGLAFGIVSILAVIVFMQLDNNNSDVFHFTEETSQVLSSIPDSFLIQENSILGGDQLSYFDAMEDNKFSDMLINDYFDYIEYKDLLNAESIEEEELNDIYNSISNKKIM